MFQISAPPPDTVQMPAEYEADPGSDGEPMSASVHPVGIWAAAFPADASKATAIAISSHRAIPTAG